MDGDLIHGKSQMVSFSDTISKFKMLNLGELTGF